jgi:CRISPR system Cascade subunit CasC
MPTPPPSRYLDLHALQTIPAACLNRGEDQEPKTLMLGHTVRALASAQCWKRVIRLNIENRLDEHAVRTRSIPPRLARALRTAGWPEDLATFAGAQVALCAGGDGLKTDPKEGGRTLAMVYANEHRLMSDLVALCEQHRIALHEAHQAAATQPEEKTKRGTKSKKKDEKVLPEKAVNTVLTGRTATINLLGRMLAGVPGGHVEGAVHLAPAFTVHASDPQPDFFTAVEDWPEPGASGSAHLQTAFFTTGIFYRYAAVNVTELAGNLDHPGTTREMLALFAEEFITSLPQAKRTSTAPHTLPYLVHYAVRDRRPVSYAGAFEQPVTAARAGGYTDPARHTLVRYAAAMTRLTGTRLRIAHGHAGIHDDPLEELGAHHLSYDDLVDAAVTAGCTTPASEFGPVTA